MYTLSRALYHIPPPISRFFYNFYKAIGFSPSGREIFGGNIKNEGRARARPSPYVGLSASSAPSAAERAAGASAAAERAASAEGPTGAPSAAEGAASAKGTAGTPTAERAAGTGTGRGPAAAERPTGSRASRAGPSEGPTGLGPAGSGAGPDSRTRTKTGPGRRRIARGPGRPGWEKIKGPVDVVGPVIAPVVAPPVGALYHQQQENSQYKDDNEVTHSAASFLRSAEIGSIPQLQHLGEVKDRPVIVAAGKGVLHIVPGVV